MKFFSYESESEQFLVIVILCFQQCIDDWLLTEQVQKLVVKKISSHFADFKQLKKSNNFADYIKQHKKSNHFADLFQELKKLLMS